MGILKGLFQAKNQASVTFTDWSTPFGGSNTTSNETVTPENSLNLSAVYACINVKANALAKTPLQLFQETDAGKQRAKTHPVQYLLEVRPNAYMTPYTFWHTIETHRNTYGVAYILKEYKGTKLTSLMPLDAWNIQVTDVVDEKGNKKVFYLNSETQDVYAEDEIIRLPYFTTDGFEPKSPISVLKETIGIAKKQQKFLASYYANGTLARGVLEVSDALSKDAKDAIRRAWQEANTGEHNASKVAVLDHGITFKNLTIPLHEAEFIASQKFNIEEIARVFNVPLHMINSLDRATFSNIEQQSMDFVQNTLQPMCVAIEQELNYKLFTKREIEQGYYVKFNLASALRGDSQARANYYKTMLEIGAYNINEIRELEERQAIEGGERHYRSLNFVPLDIADEYQLSKANANTSEGGE